MYQRSDCEYGFIPSHGGVVDSIGLTSEYLKKDLTDYEIEACIYYLKNL